jgi:hypothetical protein
MNHFTDIELRRWREQGPGGDRARVVEHLAACGICAARYADTLRTTALDAAGVADDASDFLAAGYRAGDAQALRGRVPWRWFAGLAAAALLLALVVPRLVAPPEEGMRFRGAQLHALAPAGVTSGALTFTWSSAFEAPRFRIAIGSGPTLLRTAESAASPLRAPEAIVRALQPGTDYWWTVTALDASGQEIQQSPRQTFSVAPPR